MYGRNKDHALIKALSKIGTIKYQDKGLIEFVQTMSDTNKFKNNAASTCRNFYGGKKIKSAKGIKYPIPRWMNL